MTKPAAQPHLPPLHRPSALPKSRPKQSAATGVLATRLAGHLDLSRQRIQQLVDENVIARLPNGNFDLDDCRLCYIGWLRAPERRVARSQVDAEITAAKAELIRLRVAEKKRELVPLEYMRAVEDKAIGVVLNGHERYGGSLCWQRSATAAQNRSGCLRVPRAVGRYFQRTCRSSWRAAVNARTHD